MMRTRTFYSLAFSLVTACLLFFTGFASAPSDKPINQAELSSSLQLPVTAATKPGVFQTRVLRKGLHIAIGKIQLDSLDPIDAWATFTGTLKHTVMIGEAHVLQTEVNDFLYRAMTAGVKITSLHNTFLWDQPRVMSLHFEASGDCDSIAKGIGGLFKLLSQNGLHKQDPLDSKIDLSKNTLDLNLIHNLLWKGEMTAGFYRISTGRDASLNGVTLGNSMGMNTWASFAGHNDHAMVNGDLAVLEFELNDVLQALIQAHLSIVSIHTHLTGETPRVLFVHFLGIGPLKNLAQGVRAALEVQKNFRGST